ncbi:MAG: regulatory protein MerR [Firmicutes bacterium]|nr:regulatory protein MerR [Bacillota bacterium]
MAEAGQLSMADVRRLTGLTERQIRYYDTQQLVVPERTQGGHRVYTQAHIDRLLLVRDLLKGGLSIPEIRQRLESLGSAPAQAAAEQDCRHPLDQRGLEDVKLYFGSLRRPGHDSR